MGIKINFIYRIRLKDSKIKIGRESNIELYVQLDHVWVIWQRRKLQVLNIEK